MGDIADSLINGDFDFYTGEYLGRGGGFPRTSSGPMFTTRKSQDTRWRKVTSFMMSQSIKQHEYPDVVKGYGVKYTGKHLLRNACFEILKDFEGFKKYINNLNISESQ